MATSDPTGDGRYGTPGDVAAEVNVVREIYDAFARRDLDGVLACLADDIEFLLPETARRAGRDAPYHGHAGVRQYFADMSQVWEELSLHADDIRAGTAAVIVFGHVEGRVDGEALRRNVVWSWKLRGGLAVSVRVHQLPGA